MKKFNSIVLLLLFSIAVQSQTVPNGENISLDQQLSNIPQTSVSSSIIYERVISSANLYNFNKVSTFNTANFPYFKQALSEMRRASNDTKFITLDAFKSLVSLDTIPNQVDVSILNTQFHILNYNEDNPSSGGLAYNSRTNKFVSISGKEPFYMLHNTIIAPTKDFVSGSNVIYKIRNDLYFKNGTKNIKTLIADFGDGINRTLVSNFILTNQSITVNYTNSGEKISKFLVTYNDDSTITTFGKIYFYYQQVTNSFANSTNSSSGFCSSTDPLKQDFNLQADIPFTGYKAGDPTIKAKIEYRIFYAFAHTDKKVRKPIIIIDGFDPGDKRKIEDCDCENIPSCAARNTTNGIFDSGKHRAMKDLMEYYDSNVIGGNVDLLAKLRTEGYDVIVVNQPTYETTNLQNGQTVTIDGGAYYVESNAMALIKLLQQTKSLLNSSGSINEIAIVAPSMAGQISKYALSYMEKKFEETGLPIWKHNTYLWISVDSPHLGSNIPMGDQALLYLLKEGGIDAAADFYDKELSSPAAQQLLIEFHRPGTNYHSVDQNMLNAQTTSQNMSNNRGNTLFQNHYNNQFSNGLLGSDGWPQNLRKISLVNGSLTGSKTTQTLNGSPFISFANDGEKVFNFRGFQRVHINLQWPLGSITFRTHIASLEANNLPSNGSVARIARFKKLFDDKTTISPNINIRGCMDNTPGGFFGAQADISEATTSQDPVPGLTLTELNNWSLNNFSLENIFKSISEILGGSEWYRHEFNPIHSFIPSFSAIGHLQPDQNWANPLNTNLTCPSNKLTPFDSYFGLERNTQHTSFTKESVDWLIKELGGIHQVPNFPIQENAMSGPDFVCSTSTYSFSDICKIPSAVTWSWSSNLQVVSQSAYSINVSKVSDGAGFIKATFQNGQTLTKTIWVGVPKFNNLQPIGSQYGYDPSEPNLSVSPDGDGCNQIRLNAVFDSPNILEYQWEKVTTSVAWSVSPNSGYIYIYPQCNQNFSFKVRARNICGWSDWKEFEYALNRCTIDCNTTTPIINTGLNFTLNPNPVTNDILNINVKYNAPWFIIPVNIGNGNNFDITNEFGESNYQLIPNISVNISIFNQLGVPVLQFPNTSVHPTPAELDVSSLQAGTYVVVFEYQGQVESYTIIKN